jgi:hypothetical protein
MSDLPRFPVPFLERLLELSRWLDVARLLSVDRRESPGRSWLFNSKTILVAERCTSDGGLHDFLARYPQCGVRATVPSWRFPCDASPGVSRITDLTIASCYLYAFVWPPKLQKLFVSSDARVLHIYTMRVASAPLAAELPATLKELWIPLSAEGVALPVSLTKLTLTGGTEAPWAHNLSRLVNLTELTIKGPPNTVLVSIQGAWPPHLAKLTLTTFGRPLIYRAVRWPPRLTHLRLMTVNAPDEPLPDTITHLAISARLADIGLTVWPAALKHLHLTFVAHPGVTVAGIRAACRQLGVPIDRLACFVSHWHQRRCCREWGEPE